MARCFLFLIALGGMAWLMLPQKSSAVADRPAKSPWGTLTGRITWGGQTVPKQRRLKITRDSKHCLAGGPILSEDYVINPKNKGVRWVIGFLMANGKKPLPVHPDLRRPASRVVTLDISFGRFKPHVVVMRRGQDLTINNSQPICYNAHWSGFDARDQAGNVLLAPNSSQLLRDMKPQRVVLSVRDNIHPWMKAWIKVFDHPYFAVTDANGKFTIPKAPAGNHRLILWQESIGWGPGGKAGVTVTIQGGQETDVKFKLVPRD
jgi:hypothetical protein